MDSIISIISDELLTDFLTIIGQRKFNSAMVYPMITSLIRRIQQHSDTVTKIDGNVKQQMALTVIHQVIDKLIDLGKIDKTAGDMLTSSLDLIGPALIDFAAAAVKKVHDVVVDIETNGCKGCFSRNCK